MKNKRGISPVIATVLLIAIVIVIGLIIFLWAMRFIEEAVVKNGRNVRLVCQDINLRATIDGTTLYVTNEGNIPVYSMKIMKTRQGEIEVQEVSGLGDGDGGVYEIGEVDKAEIVPVVLGEVKTAMQNYTCSQIKIEAEKIG